MVTVSVYAEGGVMPGLNENAMTFGNNPAFRQELSRIFNEALGRTDLKIEVLECGSNKSATKIFTNKPLGVFLYTDLDSRPSMRQRWFQRMESDGIVISEEKKGFVFFWIQEMEAWFLKQPQAIEDWADEKGYTHKPNRPNRVSENKNIKGRDIECLQKKASIVLNDIIKQTFDTNLRNSRGKKIHASYSKKEDSPDMLSFINVAKLKEQDAELKAFCSKIDSLK